MDEQAGRKKYYDAFDTYYKDGNADDMIMLIGQYIDERLNRYIDILG